MNKAPFVQFTNVRKVYGQEPNLYEALKGVSFSIHEGEYVAIMGPSGSGKSTVMNILGTLDRPSAGSYRLDRYQVETMNQDQCALLRRHYIGFVFQQFNLLSRTSALENVELPLLYRGESQQERHKKAMWALERVGLGPWAHHTSAELSGGQQQRVAIARAIVTRPKLLLADEPTGSLDTKNSQEIMEILSELNQTDGMTVVLVTHEPDMARYAHRHLLFRDGCLVGDDRVGDR